MHDRIGSLLRQCLLDRLSIFQIAFDKFGPWIKRATMAFTQIIENGDAVAFVEQQLGANAPDVTGATDNENFHSRENRRPAPLINPKCGWMTVELQLAWKRWQHSKQERRSFSGAR